jgi:hypothetical protein
MIYGHNRYEINSSMLHINIHVLPREVINDDHYRSMYTISNAWCLERKLTNLWSYPLICGRICGIRYWSVMTIVSSDYMICGVVRRIV